MRPGFLPFAVASSLLACSPAKLPTPAVERVGAEVVQAHCGAAPPASAQRYVDAAQGDDTLDGKCASAQSGCGPWKTLARAFEALEPGTRLVLAAGRYEAPGVPVPSGRGDAWVTLASADGAPAVLTGTLHTEKSRFVRLQALSFASLDGASWLSSDAATHDLEVVGNVFDSSNGSAGDFSGVFVAGRNVSVCGNTFGSWLGDLIHTEAVDGFVFAHNDLSQASGQHALFQLIGVRTIIRGNVFSNPWQRTFVTNPRDDDHPTRDVLIEDNVVVASNSDGTSPLPSGDEGGDAAARIGGSHVIVRNNLFTGNRPGLQWDCSGALSIAVYDSRATDNGYLANRMERLRLYHNTFQGNALNAVGIYGEYDSIPLFADDDVFSNDVFSDSGAYHVKVCSDWMPWHTWRFDHDVFGPQGAATPFSLVTRVMGLPTGEVSLEVAQRDAGTVFSSNQAVPPAFRDAARLTAAANDAAQRTLSQLDELFRAAELTNALESAPLTTVTAAATRATTLHVADAAGFFDGFGLEAGDEVQVGTQVARVTHAGDGTLELDAPVDAAAGDGVWLTRFGVRATPGVHPRPAKR